VTSLKSAFHRGFHGNLPTDSYQENSGTTVAIFA
jgi:hypothetical protein